MRDLIIIIILIFVIVVFSSYKGKNILYQPIQPQTIYDIEISTPAQEQQIFTVEYSKSNLPTYNVYSELYLPEKFIANVVKAKSQANYIILSTDMLERKFVFIPPERKETTSQQVTTTQLRATTTEKKLSSKKEITKQQETTQKQEIQQTEVKKYELTYRDIKEYVQKSLKTYFYPGLSTGKETVISIVSYTPYHDNQGIVKFKIENKQKSFFFINTVELQTETGEKMPVKVFSEQFVQPDSEIEGYVLFLIQTKSYCFCISDGKNVYKLRFKIP